jgi:hypothetical protein
MRRLPMDSTSVAAIAATWTASLLSRDLKTRTPFACGGAVLGTSAPIVKAAEAARRLRQRDRPAETLSNAPVHVAINESQADGALS